VKNGAHVRQGDVIAKVGATGRASGPHLDWRMNLLKSRLDPQLLVDPMSP
jgi:murein DD-endopeptidase MepM/ murein hydrolase activator NlpD